MKIAIINTYANGSTGTIASIIGQYSKKQGNDVRYYYGREKQKDNEWVYVGENKLALSVSNALSFFTGKIGSFHVFSTKKLINELKKFNPDVIHIHNIHGNYLNFKLLFNYLKSFPGKVIITLHDEFLLTGRCALCLCDKWKKGCEKCPHKSAYPRTLFDKSKKLQQEKIAFLKSLKDLTLVAPSKWLSVLIDSSKIAFLDHRCIHNGLPEPVLNEIDLNGIIDNDRINILFAAYTWSEDKGALIIKELAKKIDCSKFNIVVAGYDDYCSNWFDFDCKKVGLLKREQLLFLLNKVDVFVNPTFKDNLPTILIESLQVGTPAITFDTGGCGEIIDNSCGTIVSNKTSEALLEVIEHFDYKKNWKAHCYNKAKDFSLEKMANSYLTLYKE